MASHQNAQNRRASARTQEHRIITSKLLRGVHIISRTLREMLRTQHAELPVVSSAHQTAHILPAHQMRIIFRLFAPSRPQMAVPDIVILNLIIRSQEAKLFIILNLKHIT